MSTAEPRLARTVAGSSVASTVPPPWAAVARHSVASTAPPPWAAAAGPVP
jgi:hypothetical protein